MRFVVPRRTDDDPMMDSRRKFMDYFYSPDCVIECGTDT